MVLTADAMVVAALLARVVDGRAPRHAVADVVDGAVVVVEGMGVVRHDTREKLGVALDPEAAASPLARAPLPVAMLPWRTGACKWSAAIDDSVVQVVNSAGRTLSSDR